MSAVSGLAFALLAAATLLTIAARNSGDGDPDTYRLVSDILIVIAMLIVLGQSVFGTS